MENQKIRVYLVMLFCSYPLMGCYSTSGLRASSATFRVIPKSKKTVSWGKKRWLSLQRGQTHFVISGQTQDWCRDVDRGVVTYTRRGRGYKKKWLKTLGWVGLWPGLGGAIGSFGYALAGDKKEDKTAFYVIGSISVGVAAMAVLAMALPRYRQVTGHHQGKAFRWLNQGYACGSKRPSSGDVVRVKVRGRRRSFTRRFRLPSSGQLRFDARWMQSLAYWSHSCNTSLKVSVSYERHSRTSIETSPSRYMRSRERRRGIRSYSMRNRGSFEVKRGAGQGHRKYWKSYSRSFKLRSTSHHIGSGTGSFRLAKKYARRCIRVQRMRRIAAIRALKARNARLKAKKEAHFAKAFPLIYAIKNAQLQVLQKLLRQRPSFSNYYQGKTSIHVAAQLGKIRFVRLLIQAGVDTNQRAKDGRTALMFASQHGHLAIVKFLLQAGAQLALTSKNGSTAISLAKRHGHQSIIKILSTSNSLQHVFGNGGKKKDKGSSFVID